MTLTIREALQLPDMVHTRLVAGAAGLDNPIRWVTIVEVLEDVSRLSEGEFLITTGYGLAADAKRQSRFIPALAARKLSGVAIHTGFYLREIPAAFVEAADRYGLPLIEVPVQMNFSTVTKAILQPIINRQFDMLSYSQAIHEQMIRVALSGRGLPAIADELARLCEGQVAITDAFGYRVASSGEGRAATEAGPRLEHTVPIRAQERYGTLSLAKPAAAWKELDRIAMQHAATLCALEFVKERAVLATEWRLQGDVAEEVLSGRSAGRTETEMRSRLIGYPLEGSHFVAALAVDGAAASGEAEPHRACIALFSRLAERNGTPYLLRERTRHLLLVFPERSESRALLAQLAAQWHDRFPRTPLRVGTSRSRPCWTQLKEAAEEAVFALACHPLLARPPALLSFEQMGGYQFLFPFHHSEPALRPLWEPLIGRLLEGDEVYGRQLVETLDAYLKENGNGLKAAQRLFIHRHTLTYRLRQLEEKMGVDMNEAADRWRLQLALMAYRLHQALYAATAEAPVPTPRSP